MYSLVYSWLNSTLDMFLVGFVSIVICSTKRSVRTNMIIEISSPHEAVSHQLHHTTKEKPVKTKTHHLKRNLKTSKLTRITTKKMNPNQNLPPFQTQRGSPSLGVAVCDVPEDLGAFLSTAETHWFHFSCLRGAILKSCLVGRWWLFCEDMDDWMCFRCCWCMEFVEAYICDKWKVRNQVSIFMEQCGCSFSMLCDILFSCFRYMRYAFGFKGIDTYPKILTLLNSGEGSISKLKMSLGRQSFFDLALKWCATPFAQDLRKDDHILVFKRSSNFHIYSCTYIYFFNMQALTYPHFNMLKRW